MRYPHVMPRERTDDVDAVCTANVREAWSALRLLREALEQHCPPGTVPNSEYLAPTFMAEAEALLKGIDALAASHPRSPKP